MIYYLVMWSMYVSPFEAGQYQTWDQCQAAARVQAVGLRHLYGPGRLYWRCAAMAMDKEAD